MPSADTLHPIDGGAHTVFLKPLLATKTLPNIQVGAFSYYSGFTNPKHSFPQPVDFFEYNVCYNFGRLGARLEIGKYCAFAHGVLFVMADANHALEGPSTYPFTVFGDDWVKDLPLADTPFPNKGDIIIGHDVWIGMQATIMPGVRIGNGAVIGAKSVVAKNIPDYAIVVGNPAKVLRLRFPENEIATLNRLAWWDWPEEHVAKAIPLLAKGTVGGLEDYAKRNKL